MTTEFAAALRHAGALALPPYIERPAGPLPEDSDDYQTIFAQHEGAVAAPTAGLHFTPALLDALERAWHPAGHRHAACRCGHLSAGAHRRHHATPHACRTRRDHARSRSRDQRRVQRVGRGGHDQPAPAGKRRVGRTACVQPFSGDTTLFIVPGYRFRVVDLLLTNFHLPRSTLFMLVCAFAGTERMRAAYAHAIEAGYRFYSMAMRACWSRPIRPLPQGEGENRCNGVRSPYHRHRRRARAGVLDYGARRRADTRLHAGRHRRHGEGDDRRTQCAPPAPPSCWAIPIT